MSRTNCEYNRDIVDSLRLDASPVTPARETGLRTMASAAGLMFINTLGHVIPPEKHQLCASMADHLVVVNPDGDDAFSQNWLSAGQNDQADHKQAAAWNFGTHYFQGEVTTLTIPQAGWKSLVPEIRDRLAKHFFSRGRARRWMDRYTEQNTVIHEGSHMLEARGLPQDFSEAGASYYADLFEQPVDGRSIKVATEADFYIRLFRGLVGEFGDDAHRVYFGSQPQETTKSRVFRRFRYDLSRIGIF